MKILHVITSLYTGGAEKLMVDLLPRLKDRGHEVDLLLFDGTRTPFRDAVEAAGITVYDLGNGGSVYSPMRLLRLIPFLRRYDIIHTHNTAPQLFAALGSLLANALFVTTEHSTSNRRRAWKWYAIIDSWMYSRYNRVICISRKAEDNLREFLGHTRAQILTVNNGIDVEKYATARPSDELGQIAPGTRKIIMVAGFRWEKDHDTLIKALNYLSQEFHLFLVGDGERRQELEALSATAGLQSRVHLLGVRNDVPQLLHEADYVVMSSHFEGLSLSSVEGMSVGKPFLASDVDGLREVVDGAGVLFPHGDAETLARKILELEHSPAQYTAVARACLDRARQFDISTMVDGYLGVYQSLKR